MTTKSDWHAAPHDVTAEKRRKPGDPPTTDEILAYGNGELSAADADRVRLWLAANPDMERALTTPFPTDDAKPGDPDYLSDDEVSARFRALQKDLRPRGRVLQFPILTALAAAMALVFAGLYWQERNAARVHNQPLALGAPQYVEAYSAPRGDGEDGVKTIEVGPAGAYLKLAVTGPRVLQWYEVALYRANSKSVLWTGTLRQDEEEHLAILIPRPFLEPGTYRIEVAALPRTDVPPDEFRVRVPAR